MYIYDIRYINPLSFFAYEVWRDEMEGLYWAWTITFGWNTLTSSGEISGGQVVGLTFSDFGESAVHNSTSSLKNYLTIIQPKLKMRNEKLIICA